MQFERLKGLRELHGSLLREALLRDKSDVVRHEAAFICAGDILPRSGDGGLPPPSRSRATPILVRHECCLSLAKFKTPKSLASLLDAANDPSPEVRSSARYAIEEMMFATGPEPNPS